jgi:cell division septation protein DedD
MREMHKWTDKVELSLDNRQIFILFFGLSVVGCFVFALGVMVGRRVEWGGAAESTPTEPLAALDAGMDDELTFAAGLREPAPIAAPAAAIAADGAAAGPTDAAGAGAPDPAMAKPDAKAGKSDKSVLASGAVQPGAADEAGKKFTLQMKAFARSEEAEAFAAPLRGNGHDVRVEATEIKGRVWHRVRLGSFETWEEGISAKESFEKSEHMIAYVVKL